jgi:hypothetical protein
MWKTTKTDVAYLINSSKYFDSLGKRAIITIIDNLNLRLFRNCIFFSNNYD